MLIFFLYVLCHLIYNTIQSRSAEKKKCMFYLRCTHTCSTTTLYTRARARVQQPLFYILILAKLFLIFIAKKILFSTFCRFITWPSLTANHKSHLARVRICFAVYVWVAVAVVMVVVVVRCGRSAVVLYNPRAEWNIRAAWINYTYLMNCLFAIYFIFYTPPSSFLEREFSFIAHLLVCVCVCPTMVGVCNLTMPE